jgi:hypothetical protein
MPRPPPSLYVVGPDGPAAAHPVAPADGLERHMAEAFEHAAVGMALVSLDGRCLRVNRSFCDLLGCSGEELLGRPLHALSPEDEVAGELQLRRRMLDGEVAIDQRERRYLHRDGRMGWALVSCSLTRDAAGAPAYFIVQAQDITRRKQADEALRESEARFRSLTMLSSDWYWEQDDALRFTTIVGNADAQPFLSHSVIGRTRWEIPGLTPLSGSWEQHRQVLLEHRPFRDFQYMRQLEGETASYVSVSGEPVFDAARRFRGYRGTARDVTSATLSERRLREAQAMLHMAAQMGRLGAWALDPASGRMTWSDEVCAIHDLPAGHAPTLGEAVGFHAPEWRVRMLHTFEACVRDGTPFDVEAPVITARGRRIWMRVLGEAEWDQFGRVRRVHGACQDVSDSRHAAEQVRTLAEQLTTTLESLTDAFFTIDGQWRFTYVNAEAERMMRTRRELLVGRSIWEALPELTQTAAHDHYQRAVREQVAVQFEEYYAPLRVWVHVKAYPSRQGLAIYARDVTERVQAQQEILRLNAQLEERVRQRTGQLEAANKELEAFSYSIAHDLRAPLGSIDGFSQVLAERAGEALDERSRHYLQRIRRAVGHMGELTDGLLALSNLSRASLRREPVDLAELARTALASLREHAPHRKVEVCVAHALVVHGDPRLLAQLVGNLVANAWKFTARREDARIEIGCTQAAGESVFFVRDNGAGFDMAYASRLFEAFQRLHSTSEFEGTGIGLAIVHKIVGRHGGRIWAEAAPERGACFHFTLPDEATPR